MIAIEKMLLLLDGIIDAFGGIWDLFNRSLNSIFADNPVILDILETYGLQDSNLIWFMLGAGVFVYVFIQLIIYLLNTVT